MLPYVVIGVAAKRSLVEETEEVMFRGRWEIVDIQKVYGNEIDLS